MADAHQATTWAHNFGTPWSGYEASTLDSNASCPRLRVVAPRVFLFSFVYGGDPVMMHHFCHHYFERVGVLRTQARFVLQAPRNATLLNQTLAELDAAGVPAQLAFSEFLDIGHCNINRRAHLWKAAPPRAWRDEAHTAVQEG